MTNREYSALFNRVDDMFRVKPHYCWDCENTITPYEVENYGNKCFKCWLDDTCRDMGIEELELSPE